MSDSVARRKSRENQKGEGRKFIIYIDLDREEEGGGGGGGGQGIGSRGWRNRGPLDAELEICWRGTEVVSVMRRASRRCEKLLDEQFSIARRSSQVPFSSAANFGTEDLPELYAGHIKFFSEVGFSRRRPHCEKDIVKNNSHISILCTRNARSWDTRYENKHFFFNRCVNV